MRTDHNSSARSAVISVLAGLTGLIGLAGWVASSAWAAGHPVFVHATQLNLRAAPAANARSLALLKINDALDPVPGSRSDGLLLPLPSWSRQSPLMPWMERMSTLSVWC